MISSKAASTVSCPGLSDSTGVSLSPGLFLSGIAPSLWALLGSVAGAVPSAASSATRYQQSEWIGFAARLARTDTASSATLKALPDMPVLGESADKRFVNLSRTAGPWRYSSSLRECDGKCTKRFHTSRFRASDGSGAPTCLSSSGTSGTRL